MLQKREAKSHYNKKRDDLALPIFQQLEKAGDEEAMLYLAYIYSDRKSKYANPELAVEYYNKAADSGEAEAMFRLAHMYFEGLGVAKNEDTGLSWLGKAAEGGHARAKEDLEKKQMSVAK